MKFQTDMDADLAGKLNGNLLPHIKDKSVLLVVVIVTEIPFKLMMTVNMNK